MNSENNFQKLDSHSQTPVHDKQFGGGLLAVVTVLGAVMVMVQGSMYYRSQASNKFVAGEKNKILAEQMAEAGVEENIADFGTRKLKIDGSMNNYTTYENKKLGSGSYSTTLSSVKLGSDADTVDLSSVGKLGTGTKSIQARMKLKKYIDTTLTPITIVIPETTVTYSSHVVPETTVTKTIKDPNSMPDLNATPAYSACMASGGKKCDVCHLPGGDVTKANVINISKSSINTHISHHGDYVTTDGTCDIYKPKIVNAITFKTILDTLLNIKDNTVYSTTVTIDTAVKVQLLSWK